MSEPTDEQITRALAEMAGIDFAGRVPIWVRPAKRLDWELHEKHLSFSPLTDWRDLGPLLAEWIETDRLKISTIWAHHKGPGTFQRAACLALYGTRT